MSEMTFKLYSPLTAELLSDGSEYWNDTDSIVLRGYELTDYVEAITAQIAEEGTNIEQYMDAEDHPYLAAHVKSIRISVEERDSELCACATVVVDEDLTEHGWNNLQDYITGQYSDGWGEGFEQRDIQVEDGILNVHFWQEDHFAFTVEQVVNEPQLEPGAVNTSQQTKPSTSTKKYEITDIAHPVYPELHRIRALRQVRDDVPAGELGGFVQSEANLSQDKDEAWLYDDSISRHEASVCGGAQLHDQAVAQDLALVTGSAVMYDQAAVCDNAIVTAGCIRDEAFVLGNARIRENTVTHIAPVVTGQSVVMGDLAGSVMVFDRGYILPGQTVDNPSRHMIGINERGAAIVRDCTHALARDSKNRNTPER